ncbi:MAG: TM2 domain-containing protein [Spirochaetaceae bacterium]|nr:TM2 domain-containing protein [Spirochaetaceae bacterium]
MFSKPFAYFLWLVSGCGWLGLHRFYLRKPVTGVVWALTGGLFGIGAIYDLLTLGVQVDNANMLAAMMHGVAPPPYGGGTRYVHDGSARIVREKESVEHCILRLAKRGGGVVSAADLALETHISMDEAKKQLESMAAKGHAEMRVQSNGSLVFTINEFMHDGGRFEV